MKHGSCQDANTSIFNVKSLTSTLTDGVFELEFTSPRACYVFEQTVYCKLINEFKILSC